MPLEEVWDLVCQAQEESLSLHRLAKIRRAGSTGSAAFWQRKLLQLYHERSGLAFKFCKHINLTTDGSTHSCRNTCATVFYSHELDQSAFGTCQTIWPSKVVGPEDYDVEKEVEKILARRECERLSAYKLLQAISKQIYLITSGNFDLDSFQVPEDLSIAISRMKPNMNRSVVNGCLKIESDVGRSDIVDVLDYARNLPLLSVMMDQGSVGCSAFAFLRELGCGYLVNIDFDKYHRLANDMKQSQKKSVEGCLLQSQLASQFVWSVNYKPFGSGAFFSEKSAALDTFLQSVTVVPWMEKKMCVLIF